MALSRGVHLTSSVRQSLIDAFARELAEEIRSESPHASGDGIFPTEWEEGLIYAADLIDPKAKK
jgi:hypothetical protein